MRGGFRVRNRLPVRGGRLEVGWITATCQRDGLVLRARVALDAAECPECGAREWRVLNAASAPWHPDAMPLGDDLL